MSQEPPRCWTNWVSCLGWDGQGVDSGFNEAEWKVKEGVATYDTAKLTHADHGEFQCKAKNPGLFFFFWERERKEGRKRGREKSTCGCILHTPTGYLACIPGMYPDWELNWWPIHWATPARAKNPGLYPKEAMMSFKQQKGMVIFSHKIKQLSVRSLWAPVPVKHKKETVEIFGE